MKPTGPQNPDAALLEPKEFGDGRGFSFEKFKQKYFEQTTGLSPGYVLLNIYGNRT